LGEVLKPQGSSGQSSGFLQQQPTHQPSLIPGAGQAAQQQAGKVLTGDLDSSLASLAENLTINKSASSSMK
jgi:phosphatidylinositol-binding clathrin assembly protein